MFQKHTIYNGISMIYTVLFLKKQISFYGWRHRYKPFHLSPSTPVMQKVSRQTWNSLRLSMIFATKDSFSQILENKPPFLKFWKKKLPLSALPYPSPLQRKGQPMHDTSYGWSEAFSRPLFYGGVFLWKFKKQNSFYRIRWHSPLPWQSSESAV